MREEIFGPVAGIMKVRSDDEAVALMNDSDFGLTAAIWTADERRGARARRAGRDRHVVHESLRLPRPGAGLGRRQGFGPRLHAVRVGYEHLTRPKSFHLRVNTMSAVLKANWNYPTRIWAGPGRIAELPRGLRRSRHPATAAGDRQRACAIRR